MYEIMSSDEAIRLIRDGDCICVNSFVGIENPVELHEALYKRYQKMQSPNHLTIISSAGFGVWDENRNAEGYIRDGAVDRLICGHFGAGLVQRSWCLRIILRRIIFLLGAFPTQSVRRQEDFLEPCQRLDLIYLLILERMDPESTESQ